MKEEDTTDINLFIILNQNWSLVGYDERPKKVRSSVQYQYLGLTYPQCKNLHGNDLDHHGTEVWWWRMGPTSNAMSFTLTKPLSQN